MATGSHQVTFAAPLAGAKKKKTSVRRIGKIACLCVCENPEKSWEKTTMLKQGGSKKPIINGVMGPLEV